MASIIDKDHFTEVSANTEVSHEEVPSNGDTWIINYFGGEAPNCADCWVALVWDYGESGEEILDMTYSSKAARKISKTIVGDGTKKLAIVLHNNTSEAVHLGGYYNATNLDG